LKREHTQRTRASLRTVSNVPQQGKQTVKRHAITNRRAFHSVDIAPRAREFGIGEALD
jgi:hypothetical protein